MKRVLGLYILDSEAYRAIYGPDQRNAIQLCMSEVGQQQTRESVDLHPELLADIEVLMSGWGAPLIDDDFLAKAPNLKAIFYAAGAIGSWATDALWKRDIIVSTASAANAIPVAEFAFAMIILGLKQVWPLSRRRPYIAGVAWGEHITGNFGRTVGLVSFGLIARKLHSLLSATDLKVVVYDPFLSTAEAGILGVEQVSLDELFERSDAVSVHTPLLPETTGLITAEQLSRMRENSVFINTARGGVIKQEELIDVARARPDIQFFLDVTTPEPLPLDSPIHLMQNVLITPHIAGSIGQECQRMGQYMAEELNRYIHQQPLLWSVDPSKMKHSAHLVRA